MLGNVHDLLTARRFVKDVAVRQRNTFRRPGRAGCVDQNGEIVGLGGRRFLIVIGGRGVTPSRPKIRTNAHA